MTRFLRLFLVLFLASMQITAVADEEEKVEVMEINGLWYKVYYYDNGDGLRPDYIAVTCPPDDYNPYYGDVIIPDYVELYDDGEQRWLPLSHIEANAFKNSDITSVYISPYAGSINDSAFESCHKLEKVVFGAHVSSEMELNRGLVCIGNCVFKDCTSLKSISIPYTKMAKKLGYFILGSNLFEGCTSLESVSFEDGIEYISGDTFRGCSNLKEVVIPQSVTNINGNAFRDCSSLEKIELSDKTEHLGSGVFYNCTSLKNVTYKNVDTEMATKYSVVLPEGFKNLDGSAFAYCQSIKSVFLPASLGFYDYLFNSVYNNRPPVFFGCNFLELIDIDKNNSHYTAVDNVIYNKKMSILIEFAEHKVNSFTVPESVTNIWDCAFYGYDNLKEINLNEGLKEIRGYAFSHTGIKDMTIPSSVTNIGESAFYNCTSLESVQLNEGLEKIDYWAFNNCPLKKVNLPSSLKEINNGAFKKSSIDCTPLTVINYSETPLPIIRESLTIFNEQPDLQKMYVPKGCKKAYEKAEGLYAHWAKSFTIYEMDDVDGIEKTTNGGIKFNIAGDYLSIDNADKGTTVSIYGVDGRLITSDIVRNGATNINISKHKGRVAILKIGNKKHKVVL